MSVQFIDKFLELQGLSLSNGLQGEDPEVYTSLQFGLC